MTAPLSLQGEQAESVGVTFKKMYKKFNSSKSLMFSQNFKLQYIRVSLVTLSVTSGQTKEHNLQPKVGKLMFSVEISKKMVVHFRHKNPHEVATANFLILTKKFEICHWKVSRKLDD